MSSEFLLRNRLSNFSSTSYNSNHSSGNHSNRFGQTVIGHDFASNILVADLAIRSTAFNSSSSSPSTSSSKSLNKASDEEQGNNDNNKKTKRRVTFNLDNVQVQTIPIYSSCSSEDSSESDISLEQEDEDCIFSPPSPVVNNVIPLPSPPPPSTPLISPLQSTNAAISERISKKASYDALQQRKQIRRRDNSNHFLTTKPGYWYPLSPATTTRSSATGGMVRYGSPLPTLRSLEMTERLINESIQREMALNPNLLHHAAAKKCNYTQETPSTATPPRSPIINNDAVSMLITDTDDDGDGDDEHSLQEKAQNNNDKTGVAINDEQPNMRNSPESFSSVLIDDDDDDDEESDTSVTTSSPEPQVKYNQGKEQVETDFTKSVYNELAKRRNQKVIPFPEYEPPKLTFPFEQNLIPISANGDVVVVPPPQNNYDPVWIDNPSPNNTIKIDQTQARDIFFVKVLKAENLDFPIDNDNTSIYCSIRYKNSESRSYDQKMAHTMMIDHEMRIQDVDPNEQIAITIHVAETQNSKKMQQSNSSWYHRIKAPSDLQRYVHEKDGSICQTLFSPDRFMTNTSLDQTASLMLVNNWYRTTQNSMNSSTSSLLLRKTSTLMKKKSSQITTAIVREKAVGKIYVQCLYLKTQGNHIPRDLDEAVEALNAKRFHNTDWQSGHLSQLGGNVKHLKKLFFKLTGGCLFAYNINLSKQDDKPLYKIPLSRATRLICDDFIVVERPQHQSKSTNPNTLVSQLEQVIMLDDEDEQEGKDNDPNQEKNNFQLIFDNGDKIHFGCGSLEERNKWVFVIEIIICKLPPLPDWIMN